VVNIQRNQTNQIYIRQYYTLHHICYIVCLLETKLMKIFLNIPIAP